MIRSARLAVAALLFTLSPALALAHAVLESSSPAVNSVVHAGPFTATLRFNSRVDGSHCSLSLVSPQGHAVPLQLAAQPAANTITGHLGNIAAGAYTLRWLAVASDGHITRGTIPFHVR